MTKEKKELLLKDLSARLPYGLFIHYHWTREGNTIDEDRELDFSDVETLKYNIENPQNDWCEISWKSYLRPMSSMTEEEKKEFEALGWRVDELDDNFPWPHSTLNVIEGIDWLNKKMFDYRGLIEKGLALEAPKGMYK